MMNIYKFAKTSNKTLHTLRLLYKAMQCNILPKKNFSSSYVTNNYNKCICGVYKHSPINKLKNHHRSFSSLFISEDVFSSEYEMEEADIGNLSHIHKIDKNYLYPSTNDPLLLEIKKCMSIQDVFDLINSNLDSLNYHHACQMLLEFHCIQKNYCEEYVEHLEKSDFEISPKEMLDNFINKLTAQKEFQVLSNIINQHCASLSISELTFCFFYFRYIKFDFSNELVSKLNTICENKIENAKHEWTLFDLMKYTYAIKTKESLRSAYLIKPTIPLILDFLDRCETENDFKFITICLHNVHTLISRTTLDLHKNKCVSLVNSGLITSAHSDTLLRIINLYNLAHWSRFNTQNISFLCKILQPSIEKMDACDIIYLHKVFQIHHTPGGINENLSKRVSVLLEEMKDDDRIKTYLKIPDLLYCQVTTTSKNNNKVLEDITRDLLKEQFYKIFPSLYKTLRYLRSSNNKKLCDTFWLYSFNSVSKCDNSDDEILQLCYKYMHFNNNMGGSYRNIEFEEKMLNKLFEMKETDSYIVPFKFCRLSAFIFGYGLHKMEITELNHHLDKLKSFLPQLHPQDIILLSKGIQIHSIFRKKQKVYSVRDHALSKFTHILEEYCQDLCSNKKLSIFDLNIIFRSYINTKFTNYKSDYLNQILLQYENLENDLNPRSIRDASYNLYLASAYIPTFADRIVDYIASQKTDINGNVLSKALLMCYILGHNIKNQEFLTYALKILERDFDVLPVLPLLDSCISLCYYNNLSESLIKKIFSLEFMDRIDEEIEYCYSKKIYPIRLRKRLMLLNRAVCLDLPQYQVPWFHKKYIDENMSPANVPAHVIFHDDVLSVLKNVISEPEALQYPAYTPYGYKIDFLLHLDNKGNPVTNVHSSDRSLSRKIAILLMSKNCFVKLYQKKVSRNETEPFVIQDILKGSTLMRMRHLELLGYKVVDISYMLWYSMYMTEPEAKFNFLKERIWSK